MVARMMALTSPAASGLSLAMYERMSSISLSTLSV
jgi:hypothetical protein